MKINIENYEALLIDYMEGGLNDAEIQQLNTFCIQNHIDFEDLSENLPVLESSNEIYDGKENLFKSESVAFNDIDEDQCKLEPDTSIVFKGKESLKKKAITLPLLAKIAAAAAVVALLFGLFWNRNENRPQDQPMAEQQIDEFLNKIPEQVQNDEKHLPELVSESNTNNSSPLTNKAQPQRIAPTPHHQSTVTTAKPNEVEAAHDIIPLLANLEPHSANEVQFSDDYLVGNSLLPQIPIYPVYYDEYLTENEHDEFEQKPSLIEQGFLWASNGKCDNLGGLIHLGLHRASHDVIHYTTKAALTAYYTIDARIEETREKAKNEE